MTIDWGAFRGRTTFITGADKNCGKTTFLNRALDELRGRGMKVAFMSAGVDGEALDYLTGAPKPRVTASAGDVLVTAARALDESPVEFETLAVLGEGTVLGRQVLARIVTGGTVELVGPVGNAALAEVLCEVERMAGVDAVLVDGAVDRLTQVGAAREAAYVLVVRVSPPTLKRMAERARLAFLLDTVKKAPPGTGTSGAFSGALTDAKLAGLPEGALVLEDMTRVFLSRAQVERLLESRELYFARRFELAGVVANMDGSKESEFLSAADARAETGRIEFCPFLDSTWPARGATRDTAATAKERPASRARPRIDSKLDLPVETIERARELARLIAEPVQEFISAHTTTSVERATLRALGADGVGLDDVPVPNIAVDSLPGSLGKGAAGPWLNALAVKGLTPGALSEAVAAGLDICDIETAPREDLDNAARELVAEFDARVSARVREREEMLEAFKENERAPLLYVIVATGNIHEDVKQAAAAAESGADVVAVIRSTAQSLLDYVPYGETTEGFGGTYATQENFRIMREALDDVSRRRRRYIRLVNYASGLCMPEIAAMGALERLDMLLNDSMYGVLFRDINMYRTFVDQHFSRMVNAYAGIIINTGEDNYLTTSDAFEKAYTVLASQFINETFALDAGLPPRLIGLGHAFEMDPELENGFLYEIAQARMAREIFPECPLKYMPPTKFVTGDIFKAYAMNTMFNFASKATGQSIHLLGMLTEGIHTPFLQDRHLALENALYVMNNIESFAEEVEFRKDGLIARRARLVLDQAVGFLEEVAGAGLFDSIEQGKFADISRAKDDGKGAEGVIRKEAGYWNPVQEHLEKKLWASRAPGGRKPGRGS
jgi:beta-lysine 5,6-aminomutase alpha subunit